MKIVLLTMDKREHDRRYDTPNPYFGTAPEALLQGFAQVPECEVHVVSCLQRSAASPKQLGPNIFYHSLVVPKFGWLRTGYSGCVLAVRKKLREIKPDIVHGQGTERYCALSALLSGFPNVVTIHGNIAQLASLFKAPVGSFYWLQGLLETFTLRRTGGVFCNSQYTESLVSPRAKKCWRVANAIQSDYFQPFPDQSHSAKPILLNVGEISPRKRQIEILEMAAKLHSEGCRFEIHFVGSLNSETENGRNFQKLIQVAEKNGFAKYCGTLSTSELVTKYDRSSALVHFPFEEAFGLVVAESMARGLQFFGSDLGGIRDICNDVPGAKLIDPNDFVALGQAINIWLQHGAKKSPISADLMKQKFHPRVIAEQHLEIYREVLAQKR